MSYSPAPRRQRRSATQSTSPAPTITATRARAPGVRSAAAILGAAALLSLPLAGCGGSTPASHSASQPAHSQATTASAPTRLSAAGSKSVAAGALRATIDGQNHTPTVNQPWRYALQVANISGYPMSGSVTIEFVFAGQVVAYDKPPTHPITNGLWQSTLWFPNSAIGYPLTLRAVAHTSAGSIALNWPITVRQ